MNVSNSYSDEVKKAIEADFLLLDSDRKVAFLAAYSLGTNKPYFSVATLPQLWSMKIFMLKSLFKRVMQFMTTTSRSP
ncbi:MAG: hypothetical protein EXR90_07965 [Methyloglobulus sp.]|nr:hypothetical protein [Methyloglobulus sp.]